MPSCCYPDDYDAVFTTAEAATTVRRFRRRGVTGTGAHVVELLTEEGIEGAEVLEVGAGVGEVLVALLERGASRAVDVDLTANWVETARSLFAERGLADRLDARIGDFVDEAASLPAVDVVVLNRVVCCYPDWGAMLGAAAQGTRRLLALTYPTDRWWNRLGLGLANLYFRVRGLRFRVFVHPSQAMRELLASAGFSVARERRGFIWRTVVFRRTAEA